MRTNREFLKSLKAPTSSFYLCDFHVHSPGSADTRIGDRFDSLSSAEKQLMPKLASLPMDLAKYDKQAVSDCPVAKFYDLLVKHRDDIARAQGISEGYEWAFIAVTDHNVAEYAAELSQHAWGLIKEKRLVVLPGIELDVSFRTNANGESDRCGIHLLCIFPPTTTASDVRLAITQASKTNWSPGTVLKIESVSTFASELRTHPSYPAICIWHVDAECIYGHGDYIRLVERFAILTKGLLPLKNIRDHVEIENSEAWVEFDLDRKTIHWDLEVSDDWMAPELYSNIQELAESRCGGKKFFIVALGQDSLICFGDAALKQKLSELSGLEFQWE